MALDAHIQSLEKKHKDLEDRLLALTTSPSTSDIEIKSIKREKLHLKDEISKLRKEAA